MPSINFSLNGSDLDLVSGMAVRAKKLLGEQTEKRGVMEWHMDIAATHLNGCPLKLDDLATADDFNFIHDVGGIYRHLDRNTGKLTNHFRPRFAA